VTVSLLGRCPETGMVGVVITSSSPAVAARCAHVRPGVGAAATQNVTDPRLGPAVLDALAAGATAETALATVIGAAPGREYRQVTALAADGEAAAGGVAGAGGEAGAAFTGAQALGRTGDLIGPDCVAAGNLLAGEEVLAAMVAAFARGPGGHLATRLLAGLAAALEAGGEEGPVHSAGLLVAGEVAWPIVDLRVDWHDDPAGELAALWELWRPLADDYVMRALRPDHAKPYGVAGDRATA